MVFGKVDFIPVSDDYDSYVILDVHSVVFYRESGQFHRLQGGASISLTTGDPGTATSCETIQDSSQ